MAASFAFSEMAARSERSPARWRRPFWRWLDGIEAGWAIPLLLTGFIAIWMAYLVIAYLCGDLHPDVMESWILGRTLEWGGAKHPPLAGWVTRAWTSVFPLTDWSFQLLALTNSAVALWTVDLMSRRFVRGDKRIIVLLLLMLLPAYQFYAQRFNANTVLLAIWPVATCCFLRSFETRQIGWAVAAGVTAALAMLGKYYSVFLIASFLFAAICHPQRRAYFGSLAPWISIAAGLVVLAPHLHWLATTDAMPFRYAMATRMGKAFGPALIEALLFLGGLAAVLALPAITWISMVKSRMKWFARDLRAMNPGLLLLGLISVGTIVLPVITSLAFGTDLLTIWALQGLFLFSILVVGSASYPIERFYSVNLAVLVIGIAVVAALVVAPVHAFYRNTHPLGEGRNFYRLSAMELTRQWHAQFGVPLAVVGGDEEAAFAAAFYSPDHPLYEDRLVCEKCQNTSEFLQSASRRGWAALCFDGDKGCLEIIERNAAPAARIVRSEFVVRSLLWGQPGASQRFSVLMVPPSAAANITPSPAIGTSEEISASRAKPQ